MRDVGEAKKSMSHRLMIAPIGTESDSSVAKRAARRAVRDPSRLMSRPPRSTARRRAALIHYTLHSFAISTSLSCALTAVERLTVDGQYLIAQHGPFLTAHGQESGSMVDLTAQGLIVDNRPAPGHPSELSAISSDQIRP